MANNSPANTGEAGLIPASGRCPGEGNGNPIQNFCQGNPMDRGAWWAVVHGVGESWTRLQPTQQRFYLFIFCQDVRVCCPKNMNLFHMELRFS